MGVDLPLGVRAHPALRARGGGPVRLLHHLRRPGLPEAHADGPQGPGRGREAVHAEDGGGARLRFEERADRPRALRRGRGQGPRVADRRRRLRRVRQAPAGLQRRRFRRPHHAHGPPAAAEPVDRRALPPAFPPHPGRRVPGHQPRAVRAGAGTGGGRGRRRGARRADGRGRLGPVDLRVPRGDDPQYRGVRARLPGRQDDPAGAELPFYAEHPLGGQRRHQPQPGAPPEEPVDAGGRRGSDHGGRRRLRARRGPLRRQRDRPRRRRGRGLGGHRGLLPHQRPVARPGGAPGPPGHPLPGRGGHALLRAPRDQGRAGLPAGRVQPGRHSGGAPRHQPAQARHRGEGRGGHRRPRRPPRGVLRARARPPVDPPGAPPRRGRGRGHRRNGAPRRRGGGSFCGRRRGGTGPGCRPPGRRGGERGRHGPGPAGGSRWRRGGGARSGGRPAAGREGGRVLLGARRSTAARRARRRLRGGHPRGGARPHRLPRPAAPVRGPPGRLARREPGGAALGGRGIRPGGARRGARGLPGEGRAGGRLRPGPLGGRAQRTGHPHDGAHGEGPGVPGRLRHRHGGRDFPAPAQPRGGQRVGGGAPPGLRGDHPRARAPVLDARGGAQRLGGAAGDAALALPRRHPRRVAGGAQGHHLRRAPARLPGGLLRERRRGRPGRAGPVGR